jgi:hypothetical protein
MAGAAGGIFNEMRLIQDYSRPRDGMEANSLFGQKVVIDNDPAWAPLTRAIFDAYDLDLGVWVNHADFPPPIQFEAGRTDDKDYALRDSLVHSDDGLTGFTQAHIVPKDRPPFANKEGNPFHLMRV